MKPTTIITTEKLNNFWTKGVIPIVQIVANRLKELNDSLSPVAFSGSYNDLKDKPQGREQSILLSGVLAANATSISFTNAAIAASTAIDIYTDAYGVEPTAANIASSTLTLTFAKRTSAMTVKIRVWTL